MATSGTLNGIELTLQELLDAAFRACRVVPQNVSAEMLHNGKKSLQRMLNALPARTLPLWAQDRQLLSLQPFKSTASLPTGSIDIIRASRRSWSRYTGELVTSENIHTTDLGSSQRISVIGFRPLLTGSYAITIETSDDDIAYTTHYDSGTAGFTADTFVWIEFDPSITARYVKVTGIDDSIYGETFIGDDPQDVEINRINIDDYTRLPPNRRGTPYSYYVDRQAAGPVMRLWPMPDNTQAKYSALSVWRQRHIEDVGTMTQTLEIPARWQESIILMLAYRIAVDTPQIDLGVVAQLKPLADEAAMLIGADERDASPINFNVALRGYTR